MVQDKLSGFCSLVQVRAVIDVGQERDPSEVTMGSVSVAGVSDVCVFSSEGVF